MKSLFYTLWVAIKNIFILMFFVALTFLILETIKYYQNIDSEETNGQSSVVIENLPEEEVVIPVEAIEIIDGEELPNAENGLSEVSTEDNLYVPSDINSDMSPFIEKPKVKTIKDDILEREKNERRREEAQKIIEHEASKRQHELEIQHEAALALRLKAEQLAETEKMKKEIEAAKFAVGEVKQNKELETIEKEIANIVEETQQTAIMYSASYMPQPVENNVEQDYLSFLSDADAYTLVQNTETESAIAEEEKKDLSIEEDNYSLYEEELPQNIIIEGGVHKDIREIKISPTQKPPYFGRLPVIAIVIDDMGVSKRRTKDINSLNFPITSSFLTYSDNLQSQIQDSLKAGHEVMAHIPMEAKVNKDAAPDVLTVSMKDLEVIEKLGAMIDKYENIKGVNNHMGSMFTEDKRKMYDVMEVLRERNLFFLDSKTSEKSVGKEAADKYMVPYVHRNIFLDNRNDLTYILAQLRQVESLASKKGFAVAIGHPKSQTYEALKQWLPMVEKKGYKLVHLSEIVDVLNKHAEKNN